MKAPTKKVLKVFPKIRKMKLGDTVKFDVPEKGEVSLTYVEDEKIPHFGIAHRYIIKKLNVTMRLQRVVEESGKESFGASKVTIDGRRILDAQTPDNYAEHLLDELINAKIVLK